VALQVGGYEGASRCTGAATAGAKALMAWFLGAYAARGGANLGIYVCKEIAGSTTTSLHGEGRATDLGTKPYAKPAWGWALAYALVANSRELGIQCVIFDGYIWSAAHANAGWRTYGGSDKHRGHLHVELTWAAARTLTAARVEQQLGGTTPKPPPTDWTKKAIMALAQIRKGAKGGTVRTAQGLLDARGVQVTVDGDFGPKTDAAVRKFQRARKIADDGIIGKTTWHHLMDQQRLL
jgi:Putative peptidoglycan binding domain